MNAPIELTNTTAKQIPLHTDTQINH